MQEHTYTVTVTCDGSHGSNPPQVVLVASKEGYGSIMEQAKQQGWQVGQRVTDTDLCPSCVAQITTTETISAETPNPE